MTWDPMILEGLLLLPLTLFLTIISPAFIQASIFTQVKKMLFFCFLFSLEINFIRMFIQLIPFGGSPMCENRGFNNLPIRQSLPRKTIELNDMHLYSSLYIYI